MKLKTEEDVETNAPISGLEINRLKTLAYIKQEAEDSKESLKRALYSPVKIESSSLEISDCESTLSTGTKNRHCSICKITFTTRVLYLDHELHSHKTKEKPVIDLNTITCNICHRKYGSLQTYRKHMANRNNIHILSRKSKLREQISMKLTIDMPNLFCNVCSKKFKTKIYYARHLSAMHEISLPDSYLEPINLDTKSLSCKICGKLYKAKYALASHLKNKHRMVSPSLSDLIPDTYNQNNYCSVCDKTLVSRMSYLRHLTDIHLDIMPELYQGIYCKKLKMDDRKFRRYCVDCQRVFFTKVLYRIHLDKIHGIKPLQYLPKDGDPDNHCNVCNRTYSERKTLRSHMFDAHNLIVPKRDYTTTDTAPIADVLKKYCNACDRMYGTLQSYQSHISRYHGIKTFPTEASPSHDNCKEMPVIDKIGTQCTTCNKVYKSRITYKVHLSRIHGITPHSRLRKMNRGIIPDMAGKKNHCSSCDRTYCSSSNYSRHLTEFHNMKKTEIKQEDTKESLNIQLCLRN